MWEPDAVLNLLFHLITGFANPVYELGDIETEDLETADSTVDGEDLPKAHKYGQHSVGDVHLWGITGKINQSNTETDLVTVYCPGTSTVDFFVYVRKKSIPRFNHFASKIANA